MCEYTRCGHVHVQAVNIWCHGGWIILCRGLACCRLGTEAEDANEKLQREVIELQAKMLQVGMRIEV